MNEITEKDIKTAYEQFYSFSAPSAAIIPTSTRTFEVGESVQVGRLDDCVIVEVLEDGKAYRVDYTRSADRDNPVRRMTGLWWWFNIEKGDIVTREHADQMFAPYLPGQVTTTSLESLLFKMAHNGIACDPRYQRGYVWTEQDQTNLIESIFNRMAIGIFLFASHSGYLHEDDSEETRTYINFDGDEVVINKKDDYVNAIIDGQQRLTTIWKFVTNQFPYRGVYWDNLHFRDRSEFLNSMVSCRQFNEDDVSYEDVLRMFVRVNMGVSQDPKHLEGVIAKLKQIEGE